MSDKDQLSKLVALTELVFDNRLHLMREASAARAQSRMQLDAISAAGAPADLPTVTAGLVSLAYQQWADVCRSELNAVLARQTTIWIEARAEASTAFGRVLALRGVAGRLKGK